VDTLIAETNAGSRRWMSGLEDMPIPLNVIQDGGSALDLFVLPDDGLTSEEVAQMEAMEEAEDFSARLESPEQIPIVDEDEVGDEQQTFQDEFEETQAILSAPPGADFVPGIDDMEYEEECVPGANEDYCEPEESDDYNDYGTNPPSKVFDQYLETLTEEYEDTIRKYEIDSGGAD